MSQPDRVPPHDLDAECAVLSAVMLDKVAMDKLGDLQPEHFYSEANRRIFEAARALHSVGQPVDIVQVGTWLKTKDRIGQVGGMAYLTEVLNAAPAVAHVDRYGKTVTEKFRVRAIIAAAQRIEAQGYLDHGDAKEFCDNAEAAMHAIAREVTGGRRDTFAHVSVPVRAAFEEVAKATKSSGVTGTSTGLRDLDMLLTGLHGGEVYVLAGRPGMGKSALGFGIGGVIAMAGLGVVGFSEEMPARQVALRLTCSEASVGISKARAAQLNAGEWDRLTASAKRVSGLPYWIDDKPGITVPEIRSGVRRAERECAKLGTKLGVVIVDYLQLTRFKGAGSREQEIAEISRAMKELAKDFDVPVLALSQLNRGVESRADNRPMMSDLRESGAIEQDADAIVFVYRDKVYDKDSAAGDTAELIVAKQRNGPTGTVSVFFEEHTTTFKNLDVMHQAAGGWR